MSRSLTCVATDDEPIALEILEDYIKMVPELTLVAKCANAMETMAVLRKQQVDILFIDIKMPEISGIELIRSLKVMPAVIFTTAFPNYAIDGFELDAVDYLLKPVSIDRFLRAINKVLARRTALSPGPDTPPPPEKDILFVRSANSLIKLTYGDILFIESLENYVKIYCPGRVIISLSTMKNIEELLPSFPFLRIHRSYIINLNKVDHLQNNLFTIGNKQLAIGKSYRKTVADVLKNWLTA